jgi:hypothetical protein
MCRIAEVDYGDPEALQAAYRYIYPPEPGQDREYDEWLCPECFEELKNTFRWNLGD